MTKIAWKPGTLLYPVPPALVSCGTMEHPNAITVAWTGIVCSDPAMTYISVRPSRYSYNIIKESGEFVINLTHAALVRAADFCGVRSGRDVDKFKEMGLIAEPSTQISAPMIAQSPISLECKVESITPLGSHDMFLAKIVAVNVREDLVDEAGLHLDRTGLVSYAHGHYYVLGKELGKFGYSVQKKSNNARKGQGRKPRSK